LTAAMWAGVPIGDAVESIARVEDPPGRMNLTSLGSGILLVNDSYNANPTSTEAALHALRSITADRRIAVLGGMAELGDDSEQLHVSTRTVAESLGIVLVGYETTSYGDGSVSSLAELTDRIGGFRAGDAILVKGSRASRMEVVAEAIERAIAATDGTGPSSS